MVSRSDGSTARSHSSSGTSCWRSSASPSRTRTTPSEALRAALAIQRHRPVRAGGRCRLRRPARRPHRRQHGSVVVGLEGEARTAAPFNALGDTVNVASRFQEIAGQGGVVIGPTTKRQVETGFELEEMGSQDLRAWASRSRPSRSCRRWSRRPCHRACRSWAGLRAHGARADDGRARRRPRRDRLDHRRAGNREDQARLGGARPLPRPRALHRGARGLLCRRASPTGRSAICGSGWAPAPPPPRRVSGSSSRPSWRVLGKDEAEGVPLPGEHRRADLWPEARAQSAS